MEKTERKTKLKYQWLVKRLLGGVLSSAFLFALGLLLLPAAPVFWFLAIGAPFAFLRVQYSGECPVCAKSMDIRQKQGGLRCRKCKSMLVIDDGWLKELAT